MIMRLLYPHKWTTDDTNKRNDEIRTPGVPEARDKNIGEK